MAEALQPNNVLCPLSVLSLFSHKKKAAVPIPNHKSAAIVNLNLNLMALRTETVLKQLVDVFFKTVNHRVLTNTYLHYSFVRCLSIEQVFHFHWVKNTSLKSRALSRSFSLSISEEEQTELTLYPNF